MDETPSTAYFEVAKRWLTKCQENHPECGDQVPKLPTRVICVAEEGQAPYLVSAEGTHAHYATLSHCWGQSKAAMTTLENLRERQTAIPFDTLPNTFKDAIVVCRKFGIQYLWIDRLCIVQNSKSDWEKQSGAMGSIYYESTLTLAATVSRDSATGLFVQKRRSDYECHDFITLPSSFGSNMGQVYLTASSWGRAGPPATTVEVGILQTRGWVMQEKYLARRTLHFLEGQMVWWCCEKILGQSGYDWNLGQSWRRSARAELQLFARAFEQSWDLTESDDDDDTAESEDDYDAVDDQQARSQVTFIGKGKTNDQLRDPATSPPVVDNKRVLDVLDLRDPCYRKRCSPIVMNRQIDSELFDFLDDARRRTIYRIWYSAVARYSDRHLTFASDKLPAMAGTASRIQAIARDVYLAGDWRRKLDRSLFWQTRTDPTSCTPGSDRNTRCASSQLPSISSSYPEPPVRCAINCSGVFVATTRPW